MRFVFGPVASRRLGRSLGVDPIPLKTCNWNCVYCQLGRSTPMTGARREYYPRDEILDEIAAALETLPPDGVDWLTFCGSGEPTLHASLGWLIRRSKEIAEVPIAVITNGALLAYADVRKNLLAANAVLPTLDAGTDAVYRRVNRPLARPSFAEIVEGLVAFRREFRRKLWIEVMLVPGLNDSEASLRDIAAVVRAVRPDQVHLAMPARPPAESWVASGEDEILARAAAILGAEAEVVALAAGNGPAPRDGGAPPYESAPDAITEMIARHPMREEDLVAQLARWGDARPRETFAALVDAGRLQIVTHGGTRFACAAASKYV